MPFATHRSNCRSPISMSGSTCRPPIQTAARFRHYLPIFSKRTCATIGRNNKHTHGRLDWHSHSINFLTFNICVHCFFIFLFQSFGKFMQMAVDGGYQFGIRSMLLFPYRHPLPRTDRDSDKQYAHRTLHKHYESIPTNIQ